MIGLWAWRNILVITWWAHIRQTFTLISIKIMRIWKMFFYNNLVFKHKEFVSNLNVCNNGLWKIWASYIFHFSTRIVTSTHTKVFNIFFAYYMPQCQTISFQLSIKPKWLAKHISIKVFFKFTVRKRHVYIDIGWPLILNQCFYLGIWKDDRTKW